MAARLNPARRAVICAVLLVVAIASGGCVDRSSTAALVLPTTTAPGADATAPATGAAPATTTTRPLAPLALAPPPPGFVDSVRARLADPRFGGATVGLSVWMEGSGEVASHNADLLLRPGSTEKVLVAWGAFTVLGPGTSLTTEVRAEGEIHGSTLYGHLVLVGGGDPSVRSVGDHSIDRLAAEIRGRGITHIVGDLVADESRFDSERRAPGWTNFHVPNFVGPLSALAVDGNVLRTDAEYVANPAAGNLQAFRAALNRRGVHIGGTDRMGTAPGSSAVVASLQSAPVAALVSNMMTFSDNFSAEMLLKEVGFRALGRGTLENGVSAARRTAASVGVKLGGRAADGSGLSRENTRSAREWQQLLVAAREQPWFGQLVEAMPVAGRTGTLASRFRGTPADGNVRAKTGSVRASRSLSGYLTTAGGRSVVFSLVVNGDPLPPTIIPAMDDLVAAMVATPA